MNDRVKVRTRPGIGEHHRGETGTVEAPLRIHHVLTEPLHDGPQSHGAWLHGLAGQDIGVDNHRPMSGQQGSHKGFTRGDPASQSNTHDPKHAKRGPALVPGPL